MATLKAVLFDVDGTLVDSNDAHADAWVRAFAEHGIDVRFDAVRRAIGMGGDKLMPRVSALSETSPQGRQVAERRQNIFKQDYLPRLCPLRGARELVRAIKARGLATVVASSARRDELDPLLRIAGVEGLIEAATSSDDADESKPDPDIIHAALTRAGVEPEEALMIGDTPYDVQAASRAGVRTVAFRSGGWSDSDLKGAMAIYDGPWHLLEQLEHSPITTAATAMIKE